MNEYADLTLIPQYGKLQDTLHALEHVAHDIRVATMDHLAAFRARVEQKHLPQLVQLRDSIDLALVTSVQFADQSPFGEYRQHVEIPIPGVVAHLFSNTAAPHPGTMSKSSSAKYHLLIERQTEDGPAHLMVQVMGPNGVTSCHYHNETTEHFFSLVGHTLIRSRQFAEERFPWLKQKLEPHFLRMMPRTIHQLMTMEASAVNLLCLRRKGPSGRHYDPCDMSDHLYADPEKF
jgi:hypothetical protein